jgi:hypothetical protein
MADPAREADFRPEAPRQVGIAGEVSTNHLDCDVLFEDPILGLVDVAHSAVAQRRVDDVSLTEDHSPGERMERPPAFEAGVGVVLIGLVAVRTEQAVSLPSR